MAGKGKKNSATINSAAPGSAVQHTQTESKGIAGRRKHLAIATCIAIITWLFLKNCLDNTIGCWDDVPYLRENLLVRNLSREGIKAIFSKPVMGNYHPLTILSYALEYSIAELEPWLYHFDSLLLHIITTVLVYWFVVLLTGRAVAGAVTALLFGLHPMHVESVAWMAARKDVLYGVFYMAACITYIYYRRSIDTRKKVFYIAGLVLFICSLLSKPVAVTLPMVLLLIDHFEGRRLNKWALIEKMPHFLLSIATGVVALKVQETAGAMGMQKIAYNFFERIALGAYALTNYLWKAVVPAQLHCYYPYPEKINGTLPYLYYIFPLIVVALLFVLWKYVRRNKVVVFGALFFLANIALLLQLLQVGDAIVAERYSYIAYIGLFFMAGWYVSSCFEQQANKNIRTVVAILVTAYLACMGYISSERCKVWYDDTSLWRDEIEHEPKLATNAYSNLGYIYYGKWAASPDQAQKQLYYDSASYLLNKAIMLNPRFPNSYVALGEMERAAGHNDAARKVYYSGISQLPWDENIHIGLAILYAVEKNYDSSGFYFRKLIQIRPSAESYGNYANLLDLRGDVDSAIIMFDKAISLTKDNYVPYMNRAKTLQKKDRWTEMREDLQTVIKINPDIGEVYYLRSFCDTQQKNNAMALQDVEKAIALGYKNVDAGYYQQLKDKSTK